MRSITILFCAIFLVFEALGQQPPTQPQAPTEDALRPTYILGPGDQIQIRAFEVEQINEKPFRVEEDGTVNLPLVGKVKAAGLTLRELEAALTMELKKYVKEPQVIVTMVGFRAEPVFFTGAFLKPGIYTLQGRRTLVEMLSSIGGLSPNASRRIKLTRRNGVIPLPNAVEVPETKSSYVEISMGSLRENVNPAEDIVLQPFDTITVERAEMVYVQGEVGRTGGFELGERESMSVLQVLTLAGGVGREGNPKKARVLRPVLSTSRRAEITLNLTDILKGKANDFPLLPNDVLYVPRSSVRKKVWGQIATYVALPVISTLIYILIR